MRNKSNKKKNIALNSEEMEDDSSVDMNRIVEREGRSPSKIGRSITSRVVKKDPTDLVYKEIDKPFTGPEMNDEEKEVLKTIMTSVLTKGEIKVAKQRIKELYPMRNIPLTQLFPFLFSCRKSSYKERHWDHEELHKQETILNENKSFENENNHNPQEPVSFADRKSMTKNLKDIEKNQNDKKKDKSKMVMPSQMVYQMKMMNKNLDGCLTGQKYEGTDPLNDANKLWFMD